MDLARLKARIYEFIEELKNEDASVLEARLNSLASGFPFNQYEYMLMFLLDRNAITFEQYESLRNSYLSSNRYLELYTLAPRIFGEIWAQQHLVDLDARFEKPDKTKDPHYDGEYDLWIDGVKVEVKSARAIHTKKRGNISTKALHFGADAPFWMNFQQLKPDMADVFIFIGVWLDTIRYWVLSSEEIEASDFISRQHRGGIEFQIGITHNNLNDFDRYLVVPDDLAEMVFEKGYSTNRAS